MNDAELRYEIYRAFAESGAPPPSAQLAQWLGDRGSVTAALRRLHDDHAIVLDEAGAIRMALPFSAVDTGHTVVSGAQSWWANCAWDTLAIPAALAIDAEIVASYLDSGDPVGLEIKDGELSHTDGFIHFKIPARNWWDDIVET